MKHGAILALCLFYSLLSFGQIRQGNTSAQPGRDRLNLVSSSSGRINASTGHMVFFNPVYEHKGNTLSADSGYIYEDEIKQQFFEAFGHVVITQPSGTVINSDYLHYDATAQHARLTGNVKMVDATSVLTTNFLTYNMRSKVGTYQNGGRIISRGDTITSKNAYYFENTSDAYFRYKVIVRTPNVKVYTDTMRYNSITKDTYFFGPTNIKGNKNENLYTERGVYNTGTGIAKFNKNNLYTEDTKFLKGDSLYYNRDNGIGEAYRNVVFVDTLDKFYAYGGKGVYRQDEESILMTEKPLIITVVKNDTTANQETADSTAVQVDSTIRQMDSTAVQTDSTLIEVDSTAAATQLQVMEKDSIPPVAAVDSVYMTADTLYSRVIPIRDYHPLDLKLDRDGGQLIDEEEVDYGDVSETGETVAPDSTLSPLDSNSTVLPDSTALQLDAATLADSTTVVPPDPPQIKAKRPPLKTEPGNATIEMTQKADSTLRQEAVIPTGNEANDLITEALRVAQTPDTVAPDTVQQADSPPVPTLDSLGNPLDSLSSPLDSLRALPDSAKTRIVRAYYNVRLFKSDLQAVADSAYYGMVDSMFRFMGRPMIWAQGSQISADTIYMQIINQQVDNALLKNNAFMVNAVLDTVKFNQLKGRKITAFFANNNIDRLFVDGNAENLSFSADEEKQIITEMFHDRGARIKVRMENKEIIDYITIRKVDQKVYPFAMVTQENEILQGFIWRPQDRPTSKEDLLNRKREVPKETVPAAPADANASGEQTSEEPSSKATAPEDTPSPPPQS